MYDEMIENDIIDNLRDIDKNGTLLDMLLEFEEILDKIWYLCIQKLGIR